MPGHFSGIQKIVIDLKQCILQHNNKEIMWLLIYRYNFMKLNIFLVEIYVYTKNIHTQTHIHTHNQLQ